MENNHIKFSSIKQFRSVVREAPKKEIEFTGTVKLHGTNASVVMKSNYASAPVSFYAQSRNNIISPEIDHYGFAQFVHENEDVLMNAADLVIEDSGELILFGEWCGKGIVKGAGISQVEKMFVVFAVKIDNEWVNYEEWCETLKSFFAVAKKVGIFNIYNFPTYKISINFNMPELSVNKLGELTKSVEDHCPVAAAFGIDGIGEGIVWSNHEHGLRFKVKGEKHSISKVKTLAPVDVEKLNSISEFLDYALTENRLLQAQSEVNPTLDIKMMGEFIRWVFNDIIKEESDVLLENGLNEKDIGRHVSNRSRSWFMDRLET